MYTYVELTILPITAARISPQSQLSLPLLLSVINPKNCLYLSACTCGAGVFVASLTGVLDLQFDSGSERLSRELLLGGEPTRWFLIIVQGDSNHIQTRYYYLLRPESNPSRRCYSLRHGHSQLSPTTPTATHNRVR